MPTDDVIDLVELRQELIRPGALWQQIDLTPKPARRMPISRPVPSKAKPPGRVLITDYQSAGRGRQGRTWTAPPGSGIAMSILVRPEGIDPARWTWLSLLAGLAVSDGIRRTADLAGGTQVAQRRARRRAQGVRHSLRASRHVAQAQHAWWASASTLAWPKTSCRCRLLRRLRLRRKQFGRHSFPRVRR